MGYTIRPAEEKDCEQLGKLWEKFWLMMNDMDDFSMGKIVFTTYFKGIMMYIKDRTLFPMIMGSKYLKSDLKKKKRQYFVAEEDTGILLGFISIDLKKRDSIFSKDDHAYIGSFYVEEDKRNFTMGFKLYKKAEEWAIQHKMKYINADVFYKNETAKKVFPISKYEPYKIRYVKKI